MAHSRTIINQVTAAVFVVCLLLGYQLSVRKILWNDELYTQVTQIEKHSLAQILKGQLKEGCNNPLYYAVQKLIVSAAQYRVPISWNGQEDGEVLDPYSQVLLRVSSNIYMSLGVSLLVRNFMPVSPGAAVLAFLTSLSSLMVLSYWVEARPYSLFFLLTVLQLILFMRASRSPRGEGWPALALVHILLSLTTIISVGQVLSVAVILWSSGQRSIKRHLFLTLVPLLFYGYYYGIVLAGVGLYAYQIPDFWGLFFEGFAADRFFIILLSLVIGATGYISFKKPFTDGSDRTVLRNLALCSLLFIGLALFLLIYYKSREIAGRSSLSSRSLIFLAPVEIMTTVYMVVTVFRLLYAKARLWAWQFALIVIYFYIIHAMLVFNKIYGDALFAHE